MNRMFFAMILALLLTACSAKNGDYVMPVAKYESLEEKYNVSIEVFEDDTLAIILHQFDENAPVKLGEAVPFSIEGTTIKGEAQHDIRKTITFKDASDDTIWDKVKNRESITVVFHPENDEDTHVRLRHFIPHQPSR